MKGECNRTYASVSSECLPCKLLKKLVMLPLRDALATSGGAFSAKSGGAAKPAVPTGAPRFPAAFRGIRSRLDLGRDPTAGAAGKLDFRFQHLPKAENASRRGDRQLPLVSLRGNAAMAPIHRNRAAIRIEPAGTSQPDHQDSIS